ncbi:RHS repeat-associated core domain-containing protein [Streptomyces sp. R44]|uniref:RHS repeat-associated core domain-containing protein n=1 Tax=Streptomyces sp. R44 TaxID=3238633 RepID=A0AB39T9Z5_9ACTN
MAQPPDPARAEVPRDSLALDALQKRNFVPEKDGSTGLDHIGTKAPLNLAEAPAGTVTPPAAGVGTVEFDAPVQPTALTGDGAVEPAVFTQGTAATATASTAMAGAASATPVAFRPADDLPVKLGQATGEAAPTGTWQVAVQDRTAPVAQGVDGALLTVTAPATGSVPVAVQLDYAAYQNLYGADWASRLRLVQFPECYLTTPDVEECQAYEELETVNDPVTKSVTATVDTAADGTVAPVSAPAAPAPSGVMQAAYVTPVAAGGDKAVVGAVDSGAGEGGSFKATPLASSGKWAAGGSAGAFTWSYPVSVPPTPAGPAPSIALEYNSQAVDGKTATSSPQASWVGEGWDYNPGHIERRYRTCKDDTKEVGGEAPNNTAKKQQTHDLCWTSYNAVMSLNGQTTELVRVGTPGPGEPDLYRPEKDDGLRVELKTGGTNPDNDGEYWEVTTREGTKYYFGLNAVGGGHADTDSVFTAPVFGNHPGEPCHATAFADSRCNTSTKKQQAWHWGLDKAVDVHGNAMIVNWHASTNYYAVNKKTKTPEQYTRGGLPDSIEYGLRNDNLGGTPTAKVDFYLSQRCLEDGTVCASENFDKTGDPAAFRPWWDSPGNLNCKADSKLCPSFPSFWNRLRLGKIVTYGHRPGTTGLQKIDSYVLNHSFPRDWYDTSPGLWLSSIQRYAYAPGSSSAVLMSKSGVSFKEFVVDPNDMAPKDPLRRLKDQQLPNLVPRSANDARPGFRRPRIGVVATEHGGDIEVVYTGGCVTQPSVAPEANHGTCYPVRWSPDGEEKLPKLAWFNKYVVAKVIETDRITGLSKQVVTQYKYADAAWSKSDDEFTKPDLRTWSDWRGYQTVTTIKGGEVKSSKSTDPESQSYNVTRYFRGTGGVVKDSTGKVTLAADDAPQYAGQTAESIVYSGAGGRILKRTTAIPWSVQTASRARDGGSGPLLAHRVGVKQNDEIQTVGASWQAIRTSTTADQATGLPLETQTALVKPNGTGETLSEYSCTKTEYTGNPAVGLVGLPKAVRTVATSCASYGAADPATQLVSATRTSYDGLAYGATPVKGLATSVSEADAAGTGYTQSVTTQYDPLGRVRKVTQPGTGTTETQYTPGDTGGPVTSTTSLNAKGHATVTTFDPGRGLPLTVTDPNNRVVRNEYDVFGRLVKGWSATRSSGTQTPDVQISYQMADASPTVLKPSTVTVKTIKDNGTYDTHVTIYDGLMRQVQTQSEAHGPGRIIVDTRYNDHGLPWEQSSQYLTLGAPTSSLFKRKSNTLVPSLTRTFYDGLERTIRVATYHGDTFLNNTSTTYGDNTTYIRPAGVSDPATKTYRDAFGRVTKILHYTDSNSSTNRATTYEYDARGNRTKITDPAGNAWSFVFDARHQVVERTDPDSGTASMTYDEAGRVTGTVDARNSTFSAYDELGRVTSVRYGSAGAAPAKEFTYDTLPGGVGLLVSSVRHDPSGDYVSRVTGYDIGGRPTGRQTVIPANAMTTGVSGTYTYGYTYTPGGKPLTTTLPAAGGLAAEKVVTRYNSDGLAESTSGATWYTADVTYSPYGEPLRTVSGPQPNRVWTTNFLHDNTRQVRRTVVDRETANSYRVLDTRYSYDYAGKITSLGRKMTDAGVSTNDNQCYTYDAMGELVHAWTSNLANAAGGAACQSPGGWSWGYRSDAKAVRGPVAAAPDTASDTTAPDTALTDSLKAAAPVAGTVSGGATGYFDSYTFDIVGNRTTLINHDPAGDAAQDVKRTYGYGKTVTGNGTTPPYLAQPHTMTSVASTQAGAASTYAYDASGNTTTRTLPGGTQDLVWTAENRLETIKDKGVTTKYVYDADGNRLLENTPSGSVLHLGETELTTAAGNVTRATRTYSQSGAPAVIRTALNGAPTGHKLDVLLSDHQGTVNTVIALAAGQQITRRTFKPYGDLRGAKPAAWPNNRTYLGVGIDDASGLTHMGAREYDHAAGRFVSADPVVDHADPLQMNGYAYSHNSPISRSDPTGLRDPDEYNYWSRQRQDMWAGTPFPPITSFIPDYNKPRAPIPVVENKALAGALAQIYAKPTAKTVTGDGKIATALLHEMDTGTQLAGTNRWHAQKGWETLNSLGDILEKNAKARAGLGKDKDLLTDAEMRLARAEAAELWNALNAPDKTGKIQTVVDGDPKMKSAMQKARNAVLKTAALSPLTGTEFEPVPFRPPVRKGEGSNLRGFGKAFGVAGAGVGVLSYPVDVYNYGWGEASKSAVDSLLDPLGMSESMSGYSVRCALFGDGCPAPIVA